MSSEYIRNCFSYANGCHDYSTRYAAKNNLALPKPKTNYMKRTLNYNATLCWNSLPCDVRNCDNLNCFKYKLKNCDTLA